MKLGINKKRLLSFVMLVFCGMFAFNVVFAQTKMKSLLETTAETGAGFKKADQYSVSKMLGSVVQYFLSFLGVIFIILIIYAGFLWMTAHGDGDQVGKAKDIMTNSVIGLIIVLSANMIARSVFSFFITNKFY